MVRVDKFINKVLMTFNVGLHGSKSMVASNYSLES